MTATNVRVQMQQRRDTAANWTAAGPTLLAGEIGYETDTGKIKIGDGATAWASLAYLPIPDSTGELDDDLTITGNLTVQGTTTTIESTTLTVEDKNIELAVVDTPSDTTADGGGITLKGATDKTINWVDATDAWTFSEHVDIASAKEFRIDGTKVLDATSLGSAVVSSSLTSVGTIGTGTWQGTAIDAAYLDSTVVTTSDTSTVTSTMIENGTIVDGDINASAAIADTKLDTISTAGKVSNSATTATDANTASAIVARDASGDFSAGTITADLTGNADTATKLDSSRTFAVTGDVTGTVSSDLTSGASIATSIASGVIVDADVNASAAIAGTKIDPDFGSQTVETTGVFSAAGGAAATPSIAFTGDLNTGIYSPGADQLALATNGAQALYIDADGDILVADGNRMEIDEIRARDGAGLKLFDDAGAGIFIEDGGNVGIGTSVPQTLLELSANNGTAASNTLRFTDTDTTTQASQQVGAIEFFSNDTAGGPGVIGKIECYSGGTSGNGIINIKTGYASTLGSRLTIDDAGNVGIGTTSATSLLHLSTSALADLRFTDTGEATDQKNWAWQTGTGIGAGTFRLRSINDANSTGENAYIITRSGVSVQTHQLLTAGSERARIDSSGRLLVGTSSARTNIGSNQTASIQTESTANGLGFFTAYNQNNAFGSVLAIAKSRGTTVGSNTIVQSGDQIGGVVFYGADGVDTATAAGIECYVDGTPGANDMPGRLVFSVTADGASSPTEQLRITSDRYVRLASGTGGIQFNGDTAAANALDDYEEGTFTPSISYSTSNGNRAVVTQVGRYVKIGRSVSVNIAVSWTENTASGNVSITGLPFTSVNVTSAACVGQAQGAYGLTGISGGLFGRIAPNATTVQLSYGSTGVSTALNETNTIGGGGQLVNFSAVYEAA